MDMHCWYDSGYVRFYTEKCDLLMEEQFHNENITSLKCQSQHSPRPDISPELYQEELYIQYQSNVCIINGHQLFENLKTCRSQLARAQAKGSPAEFKPIPLIVKKWGFQDQSLINDVAVLGLNISNTFDHLLAASLCGGFEAKYRHTPPNSTLVLAVGSKPFLGFHYALEGVNQPVLSDVAKAVASKLKSALPGWLTGSKQNESKEVTVAMQPIDTMGLRFGLSDVRRTATDIVLSPNRKLAAISDSLGRVLLIDCFKGIIIKNFKGYREAQCAFLQVPDERRSKHRHGNKVAVFLVIYSPKKGTLEIFTVQQGTKITTFSASKYSRLLYISHGLMGFTTTSKSRYICQFTCLFLDSEGDIKEIIVPFHFALAEKNSVKARDIYFYKKMRQFIKTGCLSTDALENEIFNMCSELKTVEIKVQTVDMLLTSKGVSPEIILKCLDYFLEHGGDGVENESLINLKTVCMNVKALLELYVFVTSKNTNEENGNSVENEDNKTLPHLSAKDLEGLQKLLDLATSSSDSDLKTPRVRFCDEVAFEVNEFLASFDFTKADKLSLKEGLEDHQLFKTSEVLFKKYISGELHNFDDFSSAILSSNIPIKDLFDLAIWFWVNRPLDISQNLSKDMNNFAKTITILVKLANKKIIADVENDEIIPFWENIREILANNSRPFPALMAAMLCKNVIQRQEMENSEENIEVLTQEDVRWSLLIGKLEDVSTLNIILSSKPTIENPTLPKLSHPKIDISLKYILEHGKGSVSELTAQWLTSCGVDPQCIYVNDIIYKNSQEDANNVARKDDSDHSEKPQEILEGLHLKTIEQVQSEPMFKYLNLLKQQFPYSLEASNLLANMCWEYGISWRKEITELGNLRAAIKCLTSISDVHIQRGLFQLLWNTHLKIIVESSCKLINKVGKLPKDRLCQQDTGLSDKQITDFIEICTEFMYSFLEIALKPCDPKKPELKFEPIWENGGHQPLVELAIQQKSVDYNLLHLHYQLCMVLHMISKCAVKHSKPVNNLFDASLTALLFTDLQRQVDVNWNKSDMKIHSSRDLFLKKIITSSMETVTLNENGEIYCRDHEKWMEKCLSLARIWNMGVDEFRRFQITQLYISGYDQVAEKLIPSISNTCELGKELLKVAGNRLSQYLSSSPNLSENIAALTPMLSRYIETLNGSWCSPSDLHNITILGNLALTSLGEENRDLVAYKLARSLLEACNTLEDINLKNKAP
ncbi:rab3 GTPase-activating protein regulatory subunit isoform X2 [Anthonomus grandis grandis]|uniref:rab3 GTPase-activating protein regulatory subunit isoform X2 n=1 Tax=Anthonomus grandis grandis TaxID=2921223 RepID=UPI00216525A1|nr:rab3 GTPase-activating protein regulatory subunit isoform X2 [Anthonomus grandis grandis]